MQRARTLAHRVPFGEKGRRALAFYVANLTSEPVARRKSSDATEGEFARSEIGSLQLASDTRHGHGYGYGGVLLAAYLGKGVDAMRPHGVVAQLMLEA